MFSNTKTLLVVVACALFAQAQSNSSSTSSAVSSQPTPDSCIIGCATTAAQSAGCVTYTNATCVCASSTFQTEAGSCIQSSCPSSDLALAQALQQELCGSLSSGTASSAAASATGTSATSSSSSSSATSSSTSKSNAALGLVAPFSFDTLVGTLIASGGALVGAAFVL